MNKIGKAQRPKVASYGYELILDLHGCNPTTFTRDHLDRYFTKLCDLIEMEKCEVHFWDDVDVPPEEQQTEPHTKGTSAVCFILTAQSSSIPLICSGQCTSTSSPARATRLTWQRSLPRNGFAAKYETPHS